MTLVLPGTVVTYAEPVVTGGAVYIGGDAVIERRTTAGGDHRGRMPCVSTATLGEVEV